MAPLHVRLGLGALLADHSEIAQRFDERRKAAINPIVVRNCWPATSRPT
jgi:hypothetical protein